MKDFGVPACSPGCFYVSLDIVAEKNLFRWNVGSFGSAFVDGFCRLGDSDLVAEDGDWKARGQQGIVTVADKLPVRLAAVGEQANPHSSPLQSSQYRQHLDPETENISSRQREHFKRDRRLGASAKVGMGYGPADLPRLQPWLQLAVVKKSLDSREFNPTGSRDLLEPPGMVKRHQHVANVKEDELRRGRHNGHFP